MYDFVHKSLLSDAELLHVFECFQASGRLADVFYDDSIRTGREFVELVRRDDQHFWFFMHKGELCGMAFINGLGRSGTARIHHGMLPSTHPLIQLRMSRHFLAWLLRLKNADGSHLLEALHGLTPERNNAAVRWMRQCGFKEAGTLPYAVYMADSGRNEPGVLSYADRDCCPEKWISRFNEKETAA